MKGGESVRLRRKRRKKRKENWRKEKDKKGRLQNSKIFWISKKGKAERNRKKVKKSNRPRGIAQRKVGFGECRD